MSDAAAHVLSVMTFNVHMWHAIDYSAPNTVRVRRLLERWSPDIVVLNEVTATPDPRVVLPPTHGHLAFSPFTGCDNLIATRLTPLERWAEVIDENRSFVGLGFETCCVFGTHLDVRHEHVRCRQLETLHQRMTSLAGDRPYLLIGDYNALRGDDYDDTDWQGIAESRACSGYEMPLHAAIDVMLARGYIDAARRTPHGLQPWQERQTKMWSRFATCWAGTRIDYVWMSPGWRWPTRSYRVIDEYCSDHFPVLVEFELER